MQLSDLQSKWCRLLHPVARIEGAGSPRTFAESEGSRIRLVRLRRSTRCRPYRPPLVTQPEAPVRRRRGIPCDSPFLLYRQRSGLEWRAYQCPFQAQSDLQERVAEAVSPPNRTLPHPIKIKCAST